MLGLAGCSRQIGGPAIPVSAEEAAAPNAGSSSQKIVSWALGASDRCPSKGKKITLHFVALDSQGTQIAGRYSTPVVLIDSDKTKSTYLTRSTITGSQDATDTLVYGGKDIGAFAVDVRIGAAFATGVSFDTDSACINEDPYPIVAAIGKSAKVILAGAGGIVPPYDLDNANYFGKGCHDRAFFKKVSANLFTLSVPATARWGKCLAFVSGSLSGISVVRPAEVVLVK